jgi:hypothetical protein
MEVPAPAFTEMRYPVRRGPVRRILGPVPVLVLAFCTPSAPAGGFDQKHFQARRDTAGEYIARIEAETAVLKNHPWAGEYCVGEYPRNRCDPPGRRLRLAPQSGFAFENQYFSQAGPDDHYYATGFYDLNYGNVQVKDDGRLRLVFELPNNRDHGRGIDAELVPVTWADRHYLIPLRGMNGFVNAVNAGWSAGSDSKLLLRRGDEDKPVRGQPGLPPLYRSRLLAKPMTTTISAVHGPALHFRTKGNATMVTLDVGSASGIWKGMQFHGLGPEGGLVMAEVTEVRAHSCEAVLAHGLLPPPAAGFKLSSQVPPDKGRGGP